MRRKFQLLMLVAVIPMALALIPANAEAQHGRGRGAAGHVVQAPRVVVRGFAGGYFGYPYRWGPYWDPYWVGPFGGGWGYYGYGYRGYYDNSAELRLEVKPKEAQVYVDGYYAGVVDDFDGVFQRLHVSPGNHELVLYLNGYRSVKQNLHLGANQDTRIKYQMAPAGAGEAAEPPPQPVARPAEPEQQGYAAQPRRPAEPRRPGEPRRPAPPPPPPPPDQEPAEQGQGFGSVVIRVQPAGADILIDGERWQGPEGSERLVIQLSEGSHRIEVRKDGFTPFSTTVRVRRGETAPVNVSLPPRTE